MKMTAKKHLKTDAGLLSPLSTSVPPYQKLRAYSRQNMAWPNANAAALT